MLQRKILASPMILFALSCGTEDAAKEYKGAPGSCLIETPADETYSLPAYSNCEEWSYASTLKKDPATESLESAKSLCTATAPAKATFTAGKSCTTTGAVAKCVRTVKVSAGSEKVTQTGTSYYFGEAYRDKSTFDFWKSFCTDFGDGELIGKGTWTTIVEPLATWELSGAYSSACVKNDENQYEKNEALFILSGVTYTQKNYGDDATCATDSLAYEVASAYDFKVGLEAAAPTGFRKTNWKATSLTVTLKKQEAVDSFNQASLFEKADWALDTSTDVLGKKAQASDAKAQLTKDQVLFDIIKLENNVLTLGKETTELDRSTDAKRPNTADSLTYTKVP